jgi:hypothetical protein
MPFLMGWTRKLDPPVVLGSGRRLTTLTDARTLIGSLPNSSQRASYWQYAGALLVDAAQNDESNIVEARAQLYRALRAEGLI